MANPLTPAPQNTDNAPPQPNAPASPNQTNASVALPAAVANDPAWAARVALQQKLNPASGAPASSTPAQELFSRALPSNGGPTPTFAPPVGRGTNGRPIPGPSALPTNVADAGAKLNDVVTGGASTQLAQQGPKTLADAQTRLAQFASPEAERQRALLNAQTPGTIEHHVANPHLYTSDEFTSALKNVPRFQIMQLLQHLTPPSMQEQAMAKALQGAAASGQPGATQQELNMIAFGANPALMYNPGLLNLGVSEPKSGRGAVDPANVAR